MAKLHFDQLELIYCITLVFRPDNENITSDFRLVEDFFSMAEEPTEGHLYDYYNFLSKVLEIKRLTNHFDVETLFVHLRQDEVLESIYEEFANEFSKNSESSRISLRLYLQRKLQNAEVMKALDELATLREVLLLDDANLPEAEFTNILNAVSKNAKKIEKSLRRTQARSKHEKDDFMFGDISAINTVKRVREENTKPSARLKTSIRMKNEILNGGFNRGRIYTYLALPGIGKSFTLLNDCMDVSMYNIDVTVRDPNLKPCILYVTHENSQNETMERMFSRFHTRKIEEFSEEELVNAFMELPLNRSIPIKSIYRPNHSIDCNDIRQFIDDLAVEGFEVVLLAHDYLKRIKSIENSISKENTYLELGNITNEFKDLAIEYNIPILLASQLNREAFAKIELAVANNKADIGKNLGTSQVGESMRIIDNSDYVFGLHKEVDGNTEIEFLTMKLLKKREKQKADAISYFAHPFNKELFKLEEDIMLNASLSKLSLTEIVEGNDKLVTYEQKQTGKRLTLQERAISRKKPEIPADQLADDV